MASRTKIDDPDLADLLRGIDEGRVALPNFQRDFDWSDSDIRSLLATVINGWPMGSLLLIEGDTTTEDFYSPRAFQDAPPVSGVPETIVLDGQQRLTSLYHALYERSDLVYAVKIGEGLEWSQIDSVDAAMRTFRRKVWEREYKSPKVQWSRRLLPISALRSASDFYAWRDAATQDPDEIVAITNLYRNHLAGLHRYRVPALRIDKGMPPAAVARIFERVNKTGQRLGVFDLMVAKSFTTSFNLRTEWETAKERFPRLSRYGKDGTVVPLQVVALRILDDVRSSAVLQLTAAAIHDNWNRAVEALDAAIEFAERHLGVATLDWLPYGNLMVVLGALAWDQPLESRAGLLQSWFWRASFSGRYAVGSNTTAVADFKGLREGLVTQPTGFSIDRTTLLESTKQSSGALHRAWLCALAAAYRRQVGVDSEAELGANTVLRRGPEVHGEPQHLLTLGFCLTHRGEILDSGPFLRPPSIPEDTANRDAVEAFLNARTDSLLGFLSSACSGQVVFAQVASDSEGISD